MGKGNSLENRIRKEGRKKPGLFSKLFLGASLLVGSFLGGCAVPSSEIYIEPVTTKKLLSSRKKGTEMNCRYIGPKHEVDFEAAERGDRNPFKYECPKITVKIEDIVEKEFRINSKKVVKKRIYSYNFWQDMEELGLGLAKTTIIYPGAAVILAIKFLTPEGVRRGDCCVEAYDDFGETMAFMWPGITNAKKRKPTSIKKIKETDHKTEIKKITERNPAIYGFVEFRLLTGLYGKTIKKGFLKDGQAEINFSEVKELTDLLSGGDKATLYAEYIPDKDSHIGRITKYVLLSGSKMKREYEISLSQAKRKLKERIEAKKRKLQQSLENILIDYSLFLKKHYQKIRDEGKVIGEVSTNLFPEVSGDPAKWGDYSLQITCCVPQNASPDPIIKELVAKTYQSFLWLNNEINSNGQKLSREFKDKKARVYYPIKNISIYCLFQGRGSKEYNKTFTRAEICQIGSQWLDSLNRPSPRVNRGSSYVNSSKKTGSSSSSSSLLDKGFDAALRRAGADPSSQEAVDAKDYAKGLLTDALKRDLLGKKSNEEEKARNKIRDRFK